MGVDGFSAYERYKRKRPAKPQREFGEVVWWKPYSGAHKDKLEPRARRGIFVGVRARSGDIMVADASGICKGRITRRTEESDRWSRDLVDTVDQAPGEEGHGDGGLACGGAGDGIGDDTRVSTGVVCGDLNSGGGHFGILRNRQCNVGNHSHKDNHNRKDCGEDGSIDKEMRKHLEVLSTEQLRVS